MFTHSLKLLHGQRDIDYAVEQRDNPRNKSLGKIRGNRICVWGEQGLFGIVTGGKTKEDQAQPGMEILLVQMETRPSKNYWFS